MSKEQLKYIFGKSACLSPKQMKQYTRGQMTNEECHAVEVHLNSCAFCNEAVEGLFEQQEGNAAEVAATLNTDFLKDHFSLHQPQVHLNSMAPAQPVMQAQPRRKKTVVQPLWRPSSIAAAVLLGFGLLWYIKFGQKAVDNAQLAQALPETSVSNDVSEPAVKETQQTQALYKDVAAASGPVQQNAQAQQGNTASSNEPPPSPQAPVVLADNVETPETKIKDGAEEETVARKPASTENVNMAPYSPPLVKADTKEVDVVQTIAANKKAKTPARQRASDTQLSEEAVSRRSYESRESAKTEMSADELYDKGKYSAALSLYKQEMNNAGSRGKRQRAAVSIARCHLAMGNKQNARNVLQAIVDEGGPQKRTARKMLEDMDGATDTKD